ncbi:MAG: hypothetical protein KF773_42915 [Deltaproteobacteria bacterium]|nr:hypothetical protein [Deltaproteobacteria bacterium]MCW5804655.1 hypothetical protein [Deltaproteobacteria bacterium]
MRPALLTLPLLFAVAEARADAPASEPLRGYVLVWHDATLYADASDTAPHVRVAATLPARRAGHAFPMRVVSAGGAFVEVEPSGDVHCTWSRIATTDDIGQLRLFVRRSDLAPVVTRAHAKKFADGTAIQLRPGVPVVAQAGGWYAAGLRGDELPVEVPAASVGWSYTPEREKPRSITGHEFELAPKTKVTLGDRSVTLNAAPSATSAERRGATVMYAMEDRCIAATVAAPSASVRDSDEDASDIATGGGYGVLDLRQEDYLPAATPLFVDKRQVAISTKPIYLHARGTAKTVCFERRIKLATAMLPPSTDEIDDRLRLCAATTRVVHEKLRSSRSANGTTGR